MMDINIFSICRPNKGLVFALLAIFIIAGTKSNAGQPCFYGTVRNNNKALGFDTIIVQYLKPFSPIGIVSSKAYAVTDDKGAFSFKLPKFDHPISMIISIRIKGKYVRLDDGYLVEPSDSVKIDIETEDGINSAKFYGRGSEKFNVVKSLHDLVIDFRQKQTKIKLFYPDSLSKKLILFSNLTNEYEQMKQDLIKKSKLPHNMQRMIAYEFGNFFGLWSTACRQYFSYNYRDKPDLRSLIRESFNRNKDRFSYNYDSLMIHCRDYTFGVSMIAATNLLINDSSGKVNPVLYYNYIKNRYFGMFREKLIANFFIGNAGIIKGFEINSTTLDSLMLDGEKYITIPFVKKVYSDKLRLSKGKQIYSGSFTDVNGNKIFLDSLRGKVVLIDMWAVGCSWCAIFHERFHGQIYPELKDKKDFIYLSINSDNTKDRWEVGMQSGLYTSADYLNVNTGKVGIEHPFIKYYNIRTLPFSLLIDKNGVIFSNNINEITDLPGTIDGLLAK